MQQLRDDRQRHAGHEHALAFVEIGAAREQTLELHSADRLGLLRQPRDHGNGHARTIPIFEALDVLVDDLFDGGDRFAAQLRALVDERLQAVDVDKRNVRHVRHVGIRVARNGDIDDEERAFGTPFHRRTHAVLR